MNIYRQLTIILLLATALFLSGTTLNAQELPSINKDEPLKIQADEITYFRGENRFTATGNIIIEDSQGRLINAERLEADLDKNTFHVSGKIRIESPEGTMEAEELRTDVSSSTGYLVKGRLYISDGHYTLEGDRIEKLDDGTYFIQNAKFTPCLCEEGEKPDWSITAKNMKAKFEGYGKAKGPVFRVRDLPIFYIPAMAFPIKSKRQSGFLVPRAGYSSKGGFDLEIPYFWAISRSMDATAYEDIIEERGLKQGLEFRWATKGVADKGIINGYYLDDHYENENRWAMRTVVREELPLKLLMKWDLRGVSDNEYIPDFDRDDIGERSDRELESRFLVERQFERTNAYLFASRFDDMQGDDIRNETGHKDRDELQYQRYPKGSLRFLSRPLFGQPLYASLKLQAENLYRRGPILRDTNSNGMLDPGESLAKDEMSGRFIAEPSTYLVFKPGGLVEIVPSATLRSAGYSLPDGGDAWRAVPESQLDTSFKLGRIYGEKYKHTIEPRLRFRYVPKVKQRDIPSIYPDDIIGQAGDIFFNVDNKLWFKTRDKWNRITAMEILRVELTQGYDTIRGAPYPFRFELEARPSEFFYLDLDTRIDPESGQFKSAWAGSVMKDKRNDSLSVSYRLTPDDDEFANSTMRIRLWHEIYGLHFANYNIKERIFVEHGGGIDIWPKSECWQLMLTGSKQTRPDDFNVRVQFKLVGLGGAAKRGGEPGQ